MVAEISYGKAQISVYRTKAQPLNNIAPVEESTWTGRSNSLFAAEIDVEVFGNNFMPAYSEGDNSEVVATDTMKNFVLRQALAFQGATLEEFLAFLGSQFLETYGQMQRLRLTGKELAFETVPVPDQSFHAPSDVLFRRGHNDHGMAMLDFARDRDGVKVTGHHCGRVGMQLIKLTGSSFTSFVRDAHTTLPETVDRPLFIFLDVTWRYTDTAVMLRPDHRHYVPSEQVRDLVGTIFHQFNSKSIQHLVHEMGQRLLERFPQLAEVSFEAQNRLWDTAFTDETDSTIKVYTDPRPPYGLIRLTLPRSE